MSSRVERIGRNLAHPHRTEEALYMTTAPDPTAPDEPSKDERSQQEEDMRKADRVNGENPDE